jgi:serine/threonine protein kinase
VADDERIEQLVTQWDDLRARGERTSLDVLCSETPELLEPLRQALASREARFVEASGTMREFDLETTRDLAGGAQAGAAIDGLELFRIVRLLAEGGMGSVYEAVDRQLGRSVALKVMRPHVADFQTARERFLREARAAAAVEHDHIVPIYQVGEHNGIPYLTMPLLRGETLNDRLQRGPRLTSAEVLRISREVAEGLAAAHAHGLIHRDIKPANIWLDAATSRAKILDFGLARVANEAARLTQDGSILGTPAYMAPEQARGSEYLDERSDLFSVGSVLYRMVTGRLPFPAANAAELILALVNQDPVPPRTVDATVPQALDDLILSLLAKDPAGRPRAAVLIVEAIRAIEQSTAQDDRDQVGLDLHVNVEEEDESLVPPARSRVRLRLAGTVLIAAVALGLASGVALLSRLLNVPGNTSERSPATVAPLPPERLAGREPDTSPKAIRSESAKQWDLGTSQWNRAALDWKEGRLAEGIRSSRRAIGLIEEALRKDPANQSIISWLADAHLAAGRKYWSIGLIREAADQLNRSFDLHTPAAALRWFELGVARLYVGDVAGYRALCTRMPRRFPHERLDVVRTCVMAPSTMSDFDDIVARAEKGPDEWPKNYSPGWKVDDRALAFYRAGRLEPAIAAAQELDATAEWWWADLALIALAGGQPEVARSWLQKLDRMLAQVWSTALTHEALEIPERLHPVDQVRIQVLRREAWQKLDASPPPEDPWWLLQRGRAYTRLGEPAQAESEFQAAVAARPDDLTVGLTFARILTQLGMHDRARTQLNTLVDRNPDDPRPRIARGRFLAERGERGPADADFRRAAVLAGDDLSVFVEAGWWVVGPYPEELGQVCPPERDPDPSRPAAAFEGEAVQRWQPAATGLGGWVNLRSIIAAEPSSSSNSAYALAYVESPRERTALLLVGGNGRVRLWLNGALVHETAAARGRWGPDRVPVTLRAGRNTLLAKATSAGAVHDFLVRLGDDPIDRGDALAEQGRWSEAAALYGQRLTQGPPEDFEFHRRLATLLLAAGDRAGYRRVAAEMVRQFGNSRVPAVAAIVAETCALGNEPVASEDRLRNMAELALERPAQERSWIWSLCCDALLNCRLGQPDLAIATLTKPADANEQPPALAWTVLALAHHLRGNTEKARTYLEKADQWYDRLTRTRAEAAALRLPGRPDWWTLAAFQITRREAKALLEPNGPRAGP